MSGSSIPKPAYEAYVAAASKLAKSDPGCHLPWQLLAGIGRVESAHARLGAGGGVTAAGTVVPAIFGPTLDGSGGFAAIPDSDGGRLDGDPTSDRAVGPMQFLPGTWAAYGRDGNGDGARDPQNLPDAALAAGTYLCAAGGDVATRAEPDRGARLQPLRRVRRPGPRPDRGVHRRAGHTVAVAPVAAPGAGPRRPGPDPAAPPSGRRHRRRARPRPAPRRARHRAARPPRPRGPAPTAGPSGTGTPTPTRRTPRASPGPRSTTTPTPRGREPADAEPDPTGC